jgi:heme/copper-type cytochrome/quinol oxidase subunit 3
MIALPPAPAPAPRRQVPVLTALFVAAATTLIGAMTAVWFHFRHAAGGTNHWKPAKLAIPDLATNVWWITALLSCVMIQWAIYSAKRNDRQHATVALGMVFMLGLALINSQAYVWRRIKLPVKGTTSYNSMFYAFTATMFVLIVVGMVFAAVTAFRYIGGRVKDRESLAGLALYWYFLAAAITVVWYTIYVTK